MQRRLALIAAGLALGVGLAAGALLLRAEEEDSEPRPRAKPAETAPEPVDPRLVSVRVRPGRRVALRSRPGGPVLRRVGATTEFGSPQVLSPVSARGRWLAVRHTSLGNDGIGWIDSESAPVVLRLRRVRLVVDLSEREVSVFDEHRRERRISVAVGAPDTPTPPGEFYVTDKLRGEDFGPYYGCCILALSGRQPNLPEGWSGGDRLAIHGSLTSTWGRAVSNGCLHAAQADLAYLMRTIPLGTRVSVRA